MGCGPCQAKAAASNKAAQAARAAKTTESKFMLVSPNGDTTYYPDRIQARGANARLYKGRGMVKEVQ